MTGQIETGFIGITGPRVTKARFSVRQKPVGPPFAPPNLAPRLKVGLLLVDLPNFGGKTNTNRARPAEKK
jgi:hypothetical protein